ncbi:MAG: hypothetical protein V1738_03320 [Patescibacteria group bacterium]
MTSVNTAIVPTESAALAEPRPCQPDKMKKRQYLALSRPMEAYRESSGPMAQYVVREMEDLSPLRIILEKPSRALLAFSVFQFFAQPAILSFIGASLFGFGSAAFDIAVSVGFVIGVCSGIACAVKLSEVAHQRNELKILNGRLSEKDEIGAGAALLARLATGEAEIDVETVELPVESLFLALSQDNESVQQYVAELIAYLPQDVLVSYLSEYAKYLKYEQLVLLPGMETMTPTVAAVNGVGREAGNFLCAVLPAK